MNSTEYKKKLFFKTIWFTIKSFVENFRFSQEKQNIKKNRKKKKVKKIKINYRINFLSSDLREKQESRN